MVCGRVESPRESFRAGGKVLENPAKKPPGTNSTAQKIHPNVREGIHVVEAVWEGPTHAKCGVSGYHQQQTFSTYTHRRALPYPCCGKLWIFMLAYADIFVHVVSC